MLRPLVGEQFASLMKTRDQNRVTELVNDRRISFLRAETPSKDQRRDFVLQ
jgi:hypothetical protein